MGCSRSKADDYAEKKLDERFEVMRAGGVPVVVVVRAGGKPKGTEGVTVDSTKVDGLVDVPGQVLVEFSDGVSFFFPPLGLSTMKVDDEENK